MPKNSKTPENTEAHFAVHTGIKVPHSRHILGEVMARRIAEGRYEGAEAAAVRRIVGPTDRVIECGAGLGIVGAIAALHGKPEKIVAFEANPDLIEAINALYQLNELSSRIEVRNEVLLAGPDQPKRVSFNIRGNFLGSRMGDEAKRGRLAEVPTRDFETLRQEMKPTVLIMDIEGAERDFLKHAVLDGIRAIILEFHPKVYGIDGMRECKNILRKAGFNPDPDSNRLVWAAVRKT